MRNSIRNIITCLQKERKIEMKNKKPLIIIAVIILLAIVLFFTSDIYIYGKIWIAHKFYDTPQEAYNAEVSDNQLSDEVYIATVGDRSAIVAGKDDNGDFVVTWMQQKNGRYCCCGDNAISSGTDIETPVFQQSGFVIEDGYKLTDKIYYAIVKADEYNGEYDSIPLGGSYEGYLLIYCIGGENIPEN